MSRFSDAIKYMWLSIFVVVLVGCGKQARLDAARLDALLVATPIDTVKLSDKQRTKFLTGTEAQKYAWSLCSTNRIKASGGKGQIAWDVRLMNGSNIVCDLTQFDDRTWEFGSYCFRTKNAQ